MKEAGHSSQANGPREGINETEWVTHRFSLSLPGTFDDVIRRFESLIASYPYDTFAALLTRGGSWQEILAQTEALAPMGFLLYWKNDARPMMAAAGDSQPCVAYLMGNHTIAERMFRFDARVMNYAPLRVAFTADHDGRVWFTFDQPSTQFASFGLPAIAAIGAELDQKLATLVEHLGGSVPPALRSATPLPK